jgi:hypothetical protein
MTDLEKLVNMETIVVYIFVKFYILIDFSIKKVIKGIVSEVKPI